MKMSKLTLDEAIKHCLEVAEKNEAQAEKWQEECGEEWAKTTACREYAAEQRQLVEWLTELKDLREENKVLTRDCLRLIKVKEKLLKKVGVIAKYKRLLKMAMEDMKILYETGTDEGCIGIKFKWRYADEALKLLGDESNGI